LRVFVPSAASSIKSAATSLLMTGAQTAIAVELLAGVLGDGKPDPVAIATMKTGM